MFSLFLAVSLGVDSLAPGLTPDLTLGGMAPALQAAPAHRMRCCCAVCPEQVPQPHGETETRGGGGEWVSKSKGKFLFYLFLFFLNFCSIITESEFGSAFRGLPLIPQHCHAETERRCYCL